MISATVNKEGKIFTGQSIESLIVALDRESIISYGFNCSFGAKELIPLTKKLGKFTKNLSLYIQMLVFQMKMESILNLQISQLTI